MISYIETHVINSDWQTNVRDALLYLSTYIKYPVNDPKGIQGDLVDLTTEDILTLSAKVHTDYETAQTAVMQEGIADLLKSNHSIPIESWRKIFGNEFKTYGQFYA